MSGLGESILAEGREEGREIGEDLFASLTAKLITDGRIKDLEKATKDKSFRSVLYRQYGIKE